MASHRILYAGDDIGLPAHLRASLSGLDCFVVRSPPASARVLLASDIKYSVLMFDETAAGAELEQFTRSLKHREGVPVVLVGKSEGLGALLAAVTRRLRTPRAR
jgi:hypothetical protein